MELWGRRARRALVSVVALQLGMGLGTVAERTSTDADRTATDAEHTATVGAPHEGTVSAEAPTEEAGDLASDTGSPATGDQFGDAGDHGSMAGRRLARPIVGIAGTRSGNGYWLVASDGGVFSFGDARFFGSTGDIRLNQPIVGMAPTPSGGGYWFVASDGGVFSFGDARFSGSTGDIRLNQPIVGMAPTPSGGGYWLVAADGGVFAFGDARFLGARPASAPAAVGIAASPSGGGYWIARADGQVTAFGDAAPLARAGGGTAQAVVGIAATPSGRGYWLAGRDGGVVAFGEAAAYEGGGAGDAVGITRTATGRGYWVATAAGDVVNRVGAPAASDGPFAFLSLGSGGRPVRFDPCAPVRYAVNPTASPAGGVDEVHEAFRRLGGVTGIEFTFAGTTDEAHLPVGGALRRRSSQPERYGPGWAPVLVSWSTSLVEPLLAGATLGYGGATSYWTSNTDPAFVTGEVVLDDDLRPLRPGFGPGLTRGNLLLHELAHVVGLDHVNDRSQMMHPSITSSTPGTYAGGDAEGLRRLGRAAGCLRVASPR